MFISFVGKVVLAVGAAVVVTAGQAEELAAPPLVTRLVNFQALPDGPRISGVFRMPQPRPAVLALSSFTGQLEWTREALCMHSIWHESA